MTLRLILTRHAKSDWKDPLATDHQRSLNDRGRRAAPQIGKWLAGNGHVPALALVSDARRTRETWELLSPALPQPVPMHSLSALYAASPQAILRCLAATGESNVMVIAHNPGIGALAASLVARAPAHPGFLRYPTCATLVVEFDAAEWAELRPASGRVVDFVVPRDLPASTMA
ncbi:histidine phosphatase family protein [Rhodobacteraceae bacterium 2376]|uniref:Histidine phosphatase family protein n=1 Tax=Rhabdonatronobacter sediminivivens TaxID=2743469 RepID=A0A7Z0KXK8_9RHOB|nr:histidine phosphatase family protein [Rhabdonatronobacter sediminivivens]NYS24529.1 histidine phosphatase family protein [Rhabdonatronobacter sediminivivens]